MPSKRRCERLWAKRKPDGARVRTVIDVDLRVLSFNVRYFSQGRRGLQSSRAGVRRVAQALGSLDPLPDVICLQEVEGRSLRAWPSLEGRAGQLDVFVRALDFVLRARRRPERYAASYHPAHRYGAGPVSVYTTGLAILVRSDLPVVSTAHAEVTHRRFRATARLKQTRICAHVRLRTPRGEVDVFNTHLSLPAFLSAEFMRMGHGRNQLLEAKQLVAWIRERSTTRFVVAGDFNSVPGSPVYRQLLRELDAKDAFRESRGLSESELRSWPTCGALKVKMRLDHVMRGTGLRAVCSEGVEPFGAEGRWKDLSDHAPVAAGLLIASND